MSRSARVSATTVWPPQRCTSAEPELSGRAGHHHPHDRQRSDRRPAVSGSPGASRPGPARQRGERLGQRRQVRVALREQRRGRPATGCRARGCSRPRRSRAPCRRRAVHLYSTSATSLDDAEAVREAGRDVELAEVLRRQRHADPPAEGRRAAPDVDRDVEDLARDRADQLALRPAAAASAARAACPRTEREWLSCTNGPVDAAVAVLALGVVGLEEEPARVAEDVRLDDEHARAARSAMNRTLSAPARARLQQVLAVRALAPSAREPLARRSASM